MNVNGCKCQKMTANQRLGASDGSTHHHLRSNLSKKLFLNLFNLEKIQRTKNILNGATGIKSAKFRLWQTTMMNDPIYLTKQLYKIDGGGA